MHFQRREAIGASGQLSRVELPHNDDKNDVQNAKLRSAREVSEVKLGLLFCCCMPVVAVR